MENEENKIKKEVILALGLILVIVLGIEFGLSLTKKGTLIPPKALPTLVPNGSLKTQAIPTNGPQNYPLFVNDKGFSQKSVVVLPKGSTLIIFNTSLLAIEINEIDTNNKTVNNYKIEAGKSSTPIIKKETGTFKFTDNKGNVVVVTVQ